MSIGRPNLDAPVRAAIARADGDAAARERLAASWTALSAREPDQPKALRQFGRTLKRDHAALLRAIAVELETLRPPHPAVDTLAAELFVLLGDQGEALRIAQAMLVRFPHSLQGARLCVEAQLALGMTEAADAALRALPPNAAEAKWAVRARQTMASGAAGAGAEAEIAAAQRLLAAHDAAAAGAAATQILQLPPDNPQALRLAAAAAEQNGDMAAALLHWAALRERATNSPAGYVGALRTLRRFGRMDLAAPVLDAGREKLWDNSEFVVMAAQSVAAGKAPEQADMWWQRAVELLPDNPRHALSAAIALSGNRKGRRQRLPKVLARLERHHARFPDFAPAYAAHIDALRDMGNLDDADLLSTKWRQRFPDDIGVALARAGLLEEQKRFDDALSEIAALHARLPQAPELRTAHIRALSCAGQHEEAERRCAEARAADPRDRMLWAEYARLASRRGDWALCAARLREGLAVLPGDERLTRELRTVSAQLAEPDAAPPPPEAAENVFARFESLGGSGMGCEFGMVQRKLGSDTVGLLRWARTNAPELIAALNHDFDGVGDEANTVLTTIRLAADREEYVTRDSRYMMESHTFVRTSDAPADRMFTQTCRRLRFLRGKLLEDLRAAEKIFVYRAQDKVDDPTLQTMHAALRRFGDAALLCVMRAPKGVKPGSVRTLGRGLYVGYVGHFARDASGKTGSDVEAWSAACRQADALWQDARQAQAAP